ncbi:hypothetical protein FQA39_LY06125 [Lamprigera yunnana]|nr:hypothetical protein FQA39_LY06125 [Lamprigera yunnana]
MIHYHRDEDPQQFFKRQEAEIEETVDEDEQPIKEEEFVLVKLATKEKRHYVAKIIEIIEDGFNIKFYKKILVEIDVIGPLQHRAAATLPGYMLKEANQTVVSAATYRTLYVNEDVNTVAENAVATAVNNFNAETKNVKVILKKVIGNRDDPKPLLDYICNMYSKMIPINHGLHLILDTSMTAIPSEAVKTFSKLLGIPTISGSFGEKKDLQQWNNLDPEQSKYLIQIVPPADLIPEMIRHFVNMQQIFQAVIFFDNSFVLEHKIKSLFQTMAAQFVYVPILTTITKEHLEKLRKTNIVNFFVLGALNNAKKVLDVADSLNVFSKRFAWYVITQDKGDLTCNCRNATVIFVNPTVNSNQKRFQQIKVSIDPPLAAAFYYDLALRAFRTLRTMLPTKAWPKRVSYTSCEKYEQPVQRSFDLFQFFAKENIIPAYGDFKFTANGEGYMNFSMDIKAINIFNNKINKSKTLGTWNVNSSSLNLNDADALKIYGAAKVYQIVTVIQPPFIYKDENHTKGYSGYCIDLIDEIVKELQFDYEIRAVSNKFGTMDKRNQWNGVIKFLLNRSADIALGSISVMAERENVIDFTIPYYDSVGLTILMKLPKSSTSFFQFLTVLEYEVWLSILSAFFLTSLILWIYERWSPYSLQNNRDKYENVEEKREFSFKECLWFCMMSLTPQGGGEAPKCWSGRLVAATWWLYGFIILASYTANLAAFLTTMRLDSTVESLDDLLEQVKVKYAPHDGSFAQIYFQRMADIETRFNQIYSNLTLNGSLSSMDRADFAVWEYPVADKYNKLWKAMKEASLPSTLENAVKRVRSQNESFAYIGDATDIRYLILTNCDLTMIGEEFSRKSYALAVQQGSPLKDQLNDVIRKLLNRGRLEQLKRKWWNENPHKIDCEEVENHSAGIGIQNIGGVFIVVFVGISVATAVLVFEYMFYKYHNVTDVVKIQVPKKISTKTDTNKGESNTNKKKLATKSDKDCFNTLTVYSKDFNTCRFKKKSVAK